MAVLRRFQPATSDANGNIVFTFPPTAVNSSWTATINVPAATVGSVFTAVIEGNEHLSWQNTSPGGPLTVSGSEQLTVTGTGLMPKTQFVCVLLGTIGAPNVQASPLPMITSVLVSGIAGSVPVPTSANIDKISQALGITMSTVQQAKIFTAADDYETIVVEIYQGPATGPYAVSLGAFGVPQTLPQRAVPGRFFFATPVKAGDSIEVIYQAISGANWSAGLNVYGLGAPLQPSPLRPDGRLRAIGSQSTGANASTSTALIAAPAAGISVLLKSASLLVTSVGANGTFGQLVGVVGGFSIAPLGVSGFAGGQAFQDWGDGLLCDAATGVSLGIAGTVTVQGYVFYDLVL